MTIPPFAYHLAEADNWSSIQRYGLLSTRALLDHIGLDSSSRAAVERAYRPTRTVLPTGLVIRDQRPMPPAALQRCLVELTVPQWYELLNRKVFFWFDPARLNRQRAACRPFPQIALKLDAHRLARHYEAQAALTPINTGNARRRPALRSPATFVPHRVWTESGWLSETQPLGTRPRRPGHRPVELTIADAVPDVMDFVVSVHCLAPNEYLAESKAGG